MIGSKVMEYTDERMIPETTERDTFWEHVYRYRLASQYVKGKRVLDIACGEGYGSAMMLRAGANSLVGVDISEEACRHANSKYGIDARVGSAEAIPIEDGSVDVIVSFETIEHVPNPSMFMAECDRVLSPGGVCIISTPHTDVYSPNGVIHNPYHCSEMNEDEFLQLFHPKFLVQNIFIQHIKSAAPWSMNTLAAHESHWATARGFRRLYWWARNRYGSDVFKELDSQLRASIFENVLKKESFLTSAFNRCSLHRKTKNGQEKYAFVIVVAHKR